MYIHCNNYGYKFIEFCRNNDMFIVNGGIGENKLTCKHSSTVEYVVCNACLFKLKRWYLIHDYNNFIIIQQENNSADANKVTSIHLGSRIMHSICSNIDNI